MDGNSGALPVGRYSRPVDPAHRRRLLAAGLAGIALVTAVIVWIGHGVLTDPVQWEDVGYHVASDASVTVTFEVTKAPSARATCRVRALSEHVAEVGVVDVPVGTAPVRTQRLTVTVPTSERAVTGTVKTCELVR